MKNAHVKTLKSWDDYFRNNTTRPVEKAVLDKIDSALKLAAPGSKVLDAGCGCGKYSVHVHKKGFDITGIDYSAEAVEVARKKIGQGKNMEFDCVRLDGRLPYAAGSFDLILCVNTLHCLYDDKRAAALEQLKRVLKKDGILYLSVLSTQDKYMPRALWEEIGRNTYKDKWSDRIFHFYTKKELIQSLIGFRILDYEMLKIMVMPEKEERLHSIICVKS